MRLTLIPFPAIPFPRAPEMPVRLSSGGTPEQSTEILTRMQTWMRDVESWHRQVDAVISQNVDRINQTEFASSSSVQALDESRIGVGPTAREIAAFLDGSASPEVKNRVLAHRTL